MPRTIIRPEVDRAPGGDGFCSIWFLSSASRCRNTGFSDPACFAGGYRPTLTSLSGCRISVAEGGRGSAMAMPRVVAGRVCRGARLRPAWLLLAALAAAVRLPEAPLSKPASCRPSTPPAGPRQRARSTCPAWRNSVPSEAIYPGDVLEVTIATGVEEKSPGKLAVAGGRHGRSRTFRWSACARGRVAADRCGTGDPAREHHPQSVPRSARLGAAAEPQDRSA